MINMHLIKGVELKKQRQIKEKEREDEDASK